MKIQLKIDNEELLPLSMVNRFIWREDQVAILAWMIDESGLSLRELAERSDVSHAYINHLTKRTGNVNREILLRILKALNQPLYSVYRPPVAKIYIDTDDAATTQ